MCTILPFPPVYRLSPEAAECELILAEAGHADAMDQPFNVPHNCERYCAALERLNRTRDLLHSAHIAAELFESSSTF